MVQVTIRHQILAVFAYAQRNEQRSSELSLVP